MIRGFSLIELLVVISIVTLLSSIVFSNIRTARERSQDNSIIQQLHQLRNQAEIYRTTQPGYYGSRVMGYAENTYWECQNSSANQTMFGDSKIAEFVTAITEQANADTTTRRIHCAVGNENNDSWAFAVPLINPASGTTGWCIDSSGNSKPVNFAFNSPSYPLASSGSFALCP